MSNTCSHKMNEVTATADSLYTSWIQNLTSLRDISDIDERRYTFELLEGIQAKAKYLLNNFNLQHQYMVKCKIILSQDVRQIALQPWKPKH